MIVSTDDYNINVLILSESTLLRTNKKIQIQI